MLALFGAAPPQAPTKQPKPPPASPSADMHVLNLSASCERFPLSPSSSGTSTRSAASGIGGGGGGDGGGGGGGGLWFVVELFKTNCLKKEKRDTPHMTPQPGMPAAR